MVPANLSAVVQWKPTRKISVRHATGEKNEINYDLANAGLRQLFSNSSQNSRETQQKWSYFNKGRKNTLGKFVAWSCFSLSRGIHEKYKLRMTVTSRNSIKMALEVVFI